MATFGGGTRHCTTRPPMACACTMPSPTKDPFFWRKILIVGAAIMLAAIAAYVTVVVPRQRAQLSDAERGATVYAANCAGCHGQRLEGQPDWHHLNAAGRLPAPPLDG